ncbi:hypothetical protein BDQ17DRAFT_1351484 [Cyathus striatus]|nr:hypothetical protein BDQ17DRAFT_1351484 [Cyathus striatus]
MNRGPLVLYLLDQLVLGIMTIATTIADDDEMVKKLRIRLQEFLTELRTNAEGVAKSS